MAEATGTESKLQLVFPSSCTNSALVEPFLEIAQKKGFTALTKNAYSAVLVKTDRSMFSCLEQSGEKNKIRIRMLIEESPEDGYKIMCVSGPNKPNVVKVLKDLEKRLREVSHYWVSMFDQAVTGDETAVESRAASGAFKLDNAAYVYFFKIFSNTSYSAGKECQKMIEDFRTQTDPSEAMAVLHTMIDTVLEGVVSNLSSLQTPGEILRRDYLPRARSSCVAYLYSQVGDQLWALYYDKYEREDEKYQRMRKVLRGMTFAELFKLVELREEFSGVVEDKPEEVTLAAAIQRHARGHRASFQRACDTLSGLDTRKEQMPFGQPMEGLQALVQTVTHLKTSVLEHSKGQVDLQAMDDQIPLFILVLLQSNLRCPTAVWRFVHDSLTASQRMDSEGRIVALLETAACFVCAQVGLMQPELLEKAQALVEVEAPSAPTSPGSSHLSRAHTFSEPLEDPGEEERPAAKLLGD